jgi:ArsR family transcriptional regulator, arsenate/arsenite/antimonite-responsive transcriptional repressor
MSSNLEMMGEERYLEGMDDLATVAAAIGDPLRVRIIDLLAAGRAEPCCSPVNSELPGALCACDIAPALGGLAPSKLAYHLSQLRAAGLVREQRRGKWVYYSVNHEALAELAASITRRWKGRNSGAASSSLARRRPSRAQRKL